MLSVLVDLGSFVFTDDSKAEVFNSYFNSVNVDDDGTLLDSLIESKTMLVLMLWSVEYRVCEYRTTVCDFELKRESKLINSQNVSSFLQIY